LKERRRDDPSFPSLWIISSQIPLREGDEKRGMKEKRRSFKVKELKSNHSFIHSFIHSFC